MKMYTGKLIFINPAPAGKKADSIVLKLGDGTDQRFYLKKGETKSLMDFKNSVITVTVPQDPKPSPDGKIFLWTSKDNITVSSEAPSSTAVAGNATGGHDNKQVLIGYQALAKIAVQIASHNATLGKREITPDEVHNLTVNLLGKLLDRGLSKSVEKAKISGQNDGGFFDYDQEEETVGEESYGT